MSIYFKGNAPLIDANSFPVVQEAAVLITPTATGFGETFGGIPVIVVALTDSDGDGVPDEDDAFPNDPTEVADCDNDGVGDNADARSGELIVELQDQIARLQAQVAELSGDPTIEEIQDGRLGSIVLTPMPNTNTAILSFDIEHSDDLHPHLPRPVKLQEIRAGKAIS